MVKNSHWAGTGLAVLIGGCLVGGCAPDAFFAPSVDEAKQLHLETRVLVEKHDDNMTGQHQAMNPEAADEIGLFKQSFEDEVVRINERAKAVNSKVGAIVRDLIERFGVGGSFLAVVNGLIDEVQDDVDVVSADVDDVEARLAELKAETWAAFATVSTESLVELEKLRGDNKAFREKLQAAAKLTDAEMESLKGLSTQELMAMLLAAAGAAGAGGALGKTGKSRGAGEIEKLKDAIDKITTDAALHKAAPDTGKA